MYARCKERCPTTILHVGARTRISYNRAPPLWAKVHERKRNICGHLDSPKDWTWNVIGILDVVRNFLDYLDFRMSKLTPSIFLLHVSMIYETYFFSLGNVSWIDGHSAIQKVHYDVICMVSRSIYRELKTHVTFCIIFEKKYVSIIFLQYAMRNMWLNDAYSQLVNYVSFWVDS